MNTYYISTQTAGLSRNVVDGFSSSVVIFAPFLYTSVSAVCKHVNSIHRKSGMKTFTELFARFFTPSGNQEPALRRPEHPFVRRNGFTPSTPLRMTGLRCGNKTDNDRSRSLRDDKQKNRQRRERSQDFTGRLRRTGGNDRRFFD